MAIATMTSDQLGDLVLKGIAKEFEEVMSLRLAAHAATITKEVAEQVSKSVAARAIRYEKDFINHSINVTVLFGEPK